MALFQCTYKEPFMIIYKPKPNIRRKQIKIRVQTVDSSF